MTTAVDLHAAHLTARAARYFVEVTVGDLWALLSDLASDLFPLALEDGPIRHWESP
jgi:hypothetical protein